MVLISFTNIVVDEFSYGKRNPLKRYIYFLTHMHSDHYQGITPNWNFGPIYCSEITKKLLLNKFPQLQDVRVLEMNKQQKICLNQENKIEINVYLFDANHCPGSVMFMFEGYFGRILHTGDMRFNENLIYNNPILYPIEKRNKELKKCSLQIDECIFDNTYCDPIFKFPKREKACQMLVEIIEKHKHIQNVRFLLCVDSVGKEELLVFLSQHFETLIVVNEQRYQSILCMDIPNQLFTTNRDQGWIEVIRKNEKYERMSSQTEHCISIVCTGWANIQGYITKDDRNYLLPYSLHSNYEELELFIKSIYPSVLNTVVRNTSKGEKINNITQFSAYMVTLMNLKQRGVEFFQKNYIDFRTISKQYQSLMLNAENVSKINKALGLELSEKEKLVEDTMEFQSKHSQIFKNKKRLKNGNQLSAPNENSSFCIDKFIEIKKKIEIMKEEKVKSSQSSTKSSKKSSLIRSEYVNPYDEDDDYQSYEDKIKDENNLSTKINIIKQKLQSHILQQNELSENNSENDEDIKQQIEVKQVQQSPKIQNNNENSEDQVKNTPESKDTQEQIDSKTLMSTQSKTPPSERDSQSLSKFKYKIVKASNKSVKSQNDTQLDNKNNHQNKSVKSSIGSQINKKQIKIKFSKKNSIDKFEKAVIEDQQFINEQEQKNEDINAKIVLEQKNREITEVKNIEIEDVKEQSKKQKPNKSIPVFRNESLNKIFNQYLNKQ